MGRITVFSLDDCPHCHRAKGAFRKREIPFTEISLSSYPNRRTDMISLSDRLSVPQVFFNDKHIGGADETLALLLQNEWDTSSNNTNSKWSPLETYKKEVASQPDPTDPRLQEPTEPPDPPRQALPREASDQVLLPDSTKLSVLDLVEKRLKPILEGEQQRKRRNLSLKAHNHSFTGAEGVAALAAAFNIKEEDAMTFGKRLTERKIVQPVSPSGGVAFSNSPKHLFRLQCYHTPHILNSYRTWDTRADHADPMGVLDRLKTRLGKIESAVTDEQGLVNYKQAAHHDRFADLEEAMCELQRIDMSTLDDKTMLGFAINLYNLMIKYSFIKVGIYNDTLGLLSYFTAVKFEVGGHLYSFHDLESGILRGNRHAPYTPYAQISKDDPRHALIVDKVDCRIHFGLNCGAKSCPPVKNFTSEGLEEELRIVAMAFCEDDDNVLVDSKRRTLHLSQIISWYRMDFASSHRELPQAMVSFLRGDKKAKIEKMIADGKSINIKFNSYDWTTNASEFLPFCKSNLQADVNSVMGFLC